MRVSKRPPTKADMLKPALAASIRSHSATSSRKVMVTFFMTRISCNTGPVSSAEPRGEKIARKPAPIEINVEEAEGEKPIAPIFQRKPKEHALLSGMVEGFAVIEAGRPPEQKQQSAGSFPAQMKSGADASGHNCGYQKENRDQISKTRKEIHGPAPRPAVQNRVLSYRRWDAAASAGGAAGGSCLKWDGRPQREGILKSRTAQRAASEAGRRSLSKS